MASPYEDALNTLGQMDQRLVNWQNVEEPQSLALPSESNPTHPGLALSESPTTGGAWEQGIGLAQRGLEAITPSRDTLYKIAQGLEAGAATGQGRTPLYLQQQHMDLQRQQMMEAANERKQMMALRIQQQEEEKRQHNWGIAEKLITTGNHGALEEFAKTQFPDAMPIVQGVSKQNLSSLPTLAKQGYIPKDFMDRVMNPKPGDDPVTPAEVSMHVKLASENWQADMKEEAKGKLLTDAMNTQPEQRRPYQKLLVEEHQKKLDLQQADIELKNAQAKRALHEAEVGTRPDRSLANKVHESMFGVPFEQGTEESQRSALKSYFEGSAQGRQNVTENITVGQTGKAQEYRDPVTGQAAPSWATPKQLAELGFVNIEPSQVPAVNQIRNVDAAMKEILSSGSTLLRKETGSGNLFDIPLGFLQTPIVKLIKKYSGDPDASVLDSAIKRISPALSRLGGDTGNIAVAEQQLYASSVFSDADTLESLSKKIQSINAAQSRTKSSMGFVPDDKAYLRRLIIQGKTDEQIKAIMAERKRYQ